MLYKKLSKPLVAILVLLFFCTAMVLLLSALVRNPSIQRYLLGQVGQATGYNLNARDLKLDLLEGIGFSGRDVMVESRTRPGRIEASRLRIVLDVGKLIKGRIVPSKVEIFRPRIDLALVHGPRPLKVEDGRFFNKHITEKLSEFGSFSLKQGSLHVKGLPFGLKDLDCDVYPTKKGPVRIQVNIKGRAVSGKDSAPFVLEGTLARDKKPDSDLAAEMTLRTGKFPLAWARWPACLSFSQGVGEADIRLKAALGGPVSAEGKIIAEGVRFSLVRHEKTKDYFFDHLQADFISGYSKKIIEISSLHLKGPDFSVAASSKIDFKNQSNPHIILELESPFLPLVTFKGIFPTPFINALVNDRIFPILSGGEARLESFSLNGTNDQLKHLRLPENRDAISTRIKWKEIEIFKDGGALPFEKVSGELRFEKGALSTSLSHAVFGNSTITHASMNVHNLFEAPAFLVSVEGLFDLQDIKQQEKLDLMPSKVRQFLQGFEKLSGKVEASVEIGSEKKGVNLRIVNGKFHGTNCSAENKALYLPLVLDEADIQIDDKEKYRLRGAGRWGRSEFQVSGSTDNLWKAFKAEIAARIHMEEIMDHFGQGHQFPIKYSGPLPCRGTLLRKDGAWACQGEFDLDTVIVETDFVSADPPGKNDKVAFSVELDPGEKLVLNDLKFYLGRSAFGLKGLLGLKDNDTLDLSVMTENFLLEDLGIQRKNNHMQAKGDLSLSARVQGTRGNLQKISVIGKIAGKDISFALDALPSAVNDCHFELDFSEKDVFIHSLNMRMGESHANIQGHLQGWEGLKGEITVNADYLNVSDFIPKRTGSEDKDSTWNSFREKSNIRLSLSAQKGRWKSMIFGPLKLESGFQTGDLYITTAKAQLEHGSFAAQGHVKKEKGPERIFFTSDIKMTKQPVDHLADSLGLKKGLEGLLTMEAILSAKGMERKDLIHGLTGTGSTDFLLEEGRVKRKRGVFFKILEFLSLQNIIKWRMPDLSTKGFGFEQLEAHLNIKEGTIETDHLIFKSPVFNATAQGTVSVPSETIDFEIWVQTLETVDSLVGNVPIIGYILTGREKSPQGVLIYPLKVKGHWSDPHIRSRVLRNIAPGVLDIFKRILLTPGRILKEISENTLGLARRNGSEPEKKPSLRSREECSEILIDNDMEACYLVSFFELSKKL